MIIEDEFYDDDYEDLSRFQWTLDRVYLEITKKKNPNIYLYRVENHIYFQKKYC